MSPRARFELAWQAGRAAPAVPALLATMTIWGGSYVVTKLALADVGPFTILLLRLVLASAALMPFAWQQGFRPRMSLRKDFVLFGLTGMVLHLGFEIVGLKLTSASSAALIIATAPAVTVAFSVVLLKETLTPRQAAGIALSIGGVVLVTGGQAPAGHALAWLGNLLVFGGVVMWGIYTVQGKTLSGDHPWLVSTTAATVAASTLAFPFAAAEIAIDGAPRVDASSVAAVLYLGLLAQGIAYGLWNLALDHVDGSVAAPYVNLVPVIGVALALAAGESLTVIQALGGVTVGAGVWLNHRAAKRAARAPEMHRAVPVGAD